MNACYRGREGGGARSHMNACTHTRTHTHRIKTAAMMPITAAAITTPMRATPNTTAGTWLLEGDWTKNTTKVNSQTKLQSSL